MTWYSEFGFKSNPLDVRPNPDLVGLEKQEKQLINHITKEEITFLNGLTGSGKSSLLLRIQKKLKGHKFIYLDAQELPENFKIEDELKNKRSFFDRLALKNYPRKKPVLIIDEFQATDPNIVLQARAGWENPVKRKIKSIVIAQISKRLNNITQSFKERLGSRIIELKPLDEDEMTEILEKRLKVPHKKINLTDKITEDALSFIVRCSGNNPRRMLEYIDELFEFHHRKFGDKNPLFTQDYKISFYGAKEILGLDKVQVEGFVQKVEHASSKGVKFNKKELKLLRFIDKKPCTISDIAKRFKVSESTASKYITELKKQKSIVFAGKQQRKKLWQINPSTKRRLVKV
ncbi:MAG: AAA family ATPase [Nanobdellota archaeon]